MTDTTLAQDYIAKRQTADAGDVLARLRKFQAPKTPAEGGATAPKAPASPAQEFQAKQPKPPAGAGGGRQSLASTVGGMAAAAGGDLLEGSIETLSGRSLLYGAGKAADEMMDTIGQFIGVDFDAAERWVEEKTGLPISDKHMEELAPNSTTGKVTANVAQFLAGMVPVAKGLQAAGLAAQLGRTGTAVVAGALGDAAAFDEHAERLSNLVQSVPGLSNPVTEYLAAEEDDGVVEGKIKQVIEGAGLGAVGEGVMSGVKALKKWRDARAAMPEAQAHAGAKKAAAEAASPTAPEPEMTKRDWLQLGGTPEDDLFKVTDTIGKRADDLVAQRTPDDLDAILNDLRAPSRMEKPQPLLSYLRSRGGLREEGGELAARDLRKRLPGLVSGKGLTLEEASVSAAEEGFLPGLKTAAGGDIRAEIAADPDVLLRAIDNELAGTPQFKVGDPAAARWSDLQKWQDILDEAGIDPRKMGNAEIKAEVDKLRLSKQARPAGDPSREAMEAVDAAEAEGLDLADATPRTADDMAAETADPGYAAAVDAAMPGRVKVGNKVGNINLSRIATDDDVREVIRQTAELQGIQPTVPQSTEVARVMADNLLMDPAKMRQIMEGKSTSGRAFTREEVIATGELVAQNGKSIKALADKIVSGQASDMEKLGLKRAMAFQEALLRTVSGQAREAGRALQAFQTQVKGGSLSQNAIRDLLADGVPADRLAAIVSKTDNVAEVSALAKGGKWKNVGDAIFESWMGSKLLSPWTHARNVIGNGVTLLSTIPERYVAGRVGAMTSGGVEQGEAGQMAYGAVMGFRDAMRAGALAFKTGLPSSLDNATKAEVAAGGSNYRRAISAGKLGIDEASPIGKAVDFYGEWVNGLAFRGLVAEDEFFKSIARRMQTHALAYRTAVKEGLKGEDLAGRITELVSDPPSWMQGEAIDFARHVTFQDPLGEAGRAMSTLRRNTPMGRYVLPFLQTPGNIFRYAAARSPLAPLMPSWRADMAAGGARRDLAVAKIGLGSLVMAQAASWVAEGHITGAAPSDPQMRGTWDREGKLAYAVKLGDRWVQYNQLEPVGLTIGLAADIAQLMDVADEVKGLAADEKALDRAYQKLVKAGYSPEEASGLTQRAEDQMSSGMNALPGVIVGSIVYNMLEKSYLSGISDLAEVIFAPSPEARAQAAERYASDFATGFVPLDGPIKWAERLTDPEIREAKGLVEAMKAMTPGLSDDLPAIPNLWGDTRRSAVAYSPFGTRADTGSPIDKELERVGYAPSMPMKSIRGIKLTPAEYAEFVALAGNGLKVKGKGAKDTLDAIVTGQHPASAAYARGSDGPDGGKAFLIQKIMEGYKQAATAEMLRRHPHLRILVEGAIEAKGGAKASLAGAPTIN